MADALSTRWNAPLAALRRYVRQPADRVEVCDLCAAALAPTHQHLLDPAARRLVCACDACAVLFDNPGGTFARVPRDARRLAPSARVFTDASWDSLAIPIGMAFFLVSSPLGRVAAMYPSPAGATESLLHLETWNDIVPPDSPVRQLAPDVEALLVNRVSRRAAEPIEYLVPIDVCYRLVGLIRAQWRGFSGGSEAWAAIDRFFAELDEQAREVGEASHA